MGDDLVMKVVSKYLGVAIWIIMGLLILGATGTPVGSKIFSDNWTVCPEGPPICPYSKIQEAIDAAGDWETITIAPGTYVENLEIRKSLRLIGAGREQVRIKPADPSELTILISNAPPGLIDNPPAQVRLEGFSVVGSNTQPRPALKEIESDGEIGIMISNYVLLVAQDLEITGYYMGLSGFFSGYLDLRNIRISRNGYGVALFYSSQFVLLNSNVVENTVGLQVNSYYILTLERNNLFENEIGAYVIGRHYAEINNNRAEENEIGFVLKGALDGLYRVTMSDNKILENSFYGIVISDPICSLFFDEKRTTFDKSGPIEIKGWRNEMHNNGSDFCPWDYPRPPGFKEP